MSDIKLSNPAKIALGVGLLAVGGYFGVKIYREIFWDLKLKTIQEGLEKDIYDDETLISVYKLIIKASYPVMERGIETAHELKIRMRNEHSDGQP